MAKNQLNQSERTLIIDFIIFKKYIILIIGRPTGNEISVGWNGRTESVGRSEVSIIFVVVIILFHYYVLSLLISIGSFVVSVSSTGLGPLVYLGNFNLIIYFVILYFITT